MQVSSSGALWSIGYLTFLVNHEGLIYHKDLGLKTVGAGRQMNRFDPDRTWPEDQAK